MNVLPQTRQAAGEQTAGLLGRVLAYQQQLAQGHRNVFFRHRGQARQQLLGAFEAEAEAGG